jgi:ubiquinone/menaquinone biosynthesis C-methylase UbiE
MYMSENWNIIVNEYANMVGETGDIYHRKYLNPVVFSMLGNIKNKIILDLACGQGYFSRKLARHGAYITGVDTSDKLLAIATKKEKSKKEEKINYIIMASENISELGNNIFDCIVSNVSFHDIKNISKTVLGCSRIIKKKGRIIFSIPHPITDLSEKITADGKIKNLMDGYLSKKIEPHQFSNRLNVYHRPLGFYIAILLKYGFLISGFKEIPTLLSKGKKIKDKKLLEFKKEFPTFLIIEGTKI